MSELLKLKWSLPPKDEDYEESEDFMPSKYKKNNELNQDDSQMASKKAKFDINSTDDTVTFVDSKNCTQNINFEQQNSEIKHSLRSIGYFDLFKNNEKIKDFEAGSLKSNKSGFDLFESDKLKFSLNTSSSIIPSSFDKSKYKKIKTERLAPEYTKNFEEMDITSSFVAKQVQECEDFTKALAYSQDKPCSLISDKKYTPVFTKKKKINTDINYFKRDFSLFEKIKNIKMLRKKDQNEFLNKEQQEKYPITLQDFIW